MPHRNGSLHMYIRIEYIYIYYINEFVLKIGCTSDRISTNNNEKKRRNELEWKKTRTEDKVREKSKKKIGETNKTKK